MVLIRLSSFLLVAASLWLSGCATSKAKITANNVVSSQSQAAARMVGDARPGDVVDLPAGNVFGDTMVVVGDDYTAASGRLCRRLRSETGSKLSRIACQRESGEWYSPRALYSNKQQSTKQAFKATEPVAIIAPIDADSIDTSSVVVVELGDDNLQASTGKVRTATTSIETEKHTLKEGETLWSFSRRITGNALNWNAIAELNNIDDSRRLAAGDTLLVPKSLVRGEPYIMDKIDVSPSRKIQTSDVLDAIGTQVRVIHALILRETKTRYGQHKLGFLWAVIEPMIIVAVFVAIFASMRNDSPGGMPLVPFMLVGFVPFSLFRDVMNQLQGAIVLNKTLFAFPQVTSFDVILARGILEILITLGVFGFLLSLTHLYGFRLNVQRPLEVLAGCGLIAMLGLGVGFTFASISPILPSLRQLTSALLGRPLFLSSGLFFTAESIPSEIRQYLLYNPIMHMLELIRGAFFHEFETSHGSWQYATTWAVCSLAFGLLTHQALRKKAIVGL